MEGVTEIAVVIGRLDPYRNDDAFGNGDTTLNCNSQDQLLFEPFIVENFLSFPGCSSEMSSEGPMEKIVGNLLKGIVAGSDLVTQRKFLISMRIGLLMHLSVIRHYPFLNT
jgi:hypothetical protein